MHDAADIYMSLKYPPTVFINDSSSALVRHMEICCPEFSRKCGAIGEQTCQVSIFKLSEIADSGTTLCFTGNGNVRGPYRIWEIPFLSF